MLFSVSAEAANLEKIRDVLKHVETNHNPTAKGDNDQSFGILQIQLNAIKDVNETFGTDYTHQDAFDIVCAEEIFELYIKRWTINLKKNEKRDATEEDIVRIWNGGPKGYKRNSTLKYLDKYREYKEKLEKTTVMIKFDKESATYKFKWDILSKDDNHLLSEKGKEKLWKVFLYHMAEANAISKYNARTWTYPKKQLKSKKTKKK